MVIADVSTEHGETAVAAITQAGGTAQFVKADVSAATDVQAMFDFVVDAYGALHVLFNNAGIFPADDAGATDTPEDPWERVIDVNLRGVWLGCKYGIPVLLASGGGSIINTASFVALWARPPLRSAIQPAKAAFCR